MIFSEGCSKLRRPTITKIECDLLQVEAIERPCSSGAQVLVSESTCSLEEESDWAESQPSESDETEESETEASEAEEMENDRGTEQNCESSTCVARAHH